MEEIKLVKEDKILKDNCQTNIDGLKNMSDFLKTFINNFKTFSFFQSQKSKYKKGKDHNMYESILSNNVDSIYDSFKICVDNIRNIMNKIQNNLIKSFDLFIDEQSKEYQNNSKNIKDLIKKYNDQKMQLEYAKNNYYKSSFELRKNNNNFLLSQYSFKNVEFDNSFAVDIKNKMTAKNYESIYKNEINRYNSIVLNINIYYYIIF